MYFEPALVDPTSAPSFAGCAEENVWGYQLRGYGVDLTVTVQILSVSMGSRAR